MTQYNSIEESSNESNDKDKKKKETPESNESSGGGGLWRMVCRSKVPLPSYKKKLTRTLI